MAYFDARLLPQPTSEYVCFLDIMGMQSKMQHSLSQASNFMFKLHATILEVLRKSGYESISVYPIMDGAYITSRNRADMLKLLTLVYRGLIHSLLGEGDFPHWFLVRCSVAYGEIIHGRNIPYDASYEFSTRVGYKEQLLIGSPMIWACSTEKQAPPMGIYIHSSCASILPNWKWHLNSEIKVDEGELATFKQRTVEYFTWLDTHSNEQEYPRGKREIHRASLMQYYGIT